MREKAGDGLVGDALKFLARCVGLHVAQFPAFDGTLGPDSPLMRHVEDFAQIVDRELFIDLGQFGDIAIARTKQRFQLGRGKDGQQVKIDTLGHTVERSGIDEIPERLAARHDGGKFGALRHERGLVNSPGPGRIRGDRAGDSIRQCAGTSFNFL